MSTTIERARERLDAIDSERANVREEINRLNSLLSDLDEDRRIAHLELVRLESGR